MKLIHALLPICALLLPVALHAESTFEGKVTMKMSGDAMSKSGGQEMTYSLKPGYMRMDMLAAKGLGVMIMDLKAKQMIILLPQQKMYMVRDINEDAAKAAAVAHGSSNPQFVNTGEKTEILGYTCTKLIVTTERNTSEIWVTDQLGAFGGLGAGMGGRSQAPSPWETALKGVGFFPMRVIATEKNGKTFRLEVTAVEKESLPDALFAAPDGWRKFDLGAMMGGAFQGARPTNGDN